MISLDFARPEKMAYTATATGAAMVATLAATAALKAGWRAVRKDDPPVNPAHPDTAWTDAIAWGVACGVGIGLARLLAQRGTAAAWQAQTGHRPPGLEKV